VVVSSPNASIAIKSLEEIGELYKVEEAASGLDPGERLKIRQEKSKERVEKLFISWQKLRKELPKKSATGAAISYALNNEEALRRFLADGKIEIDNNIVERALRNVAMGRKNWTFAGSDKGGETAASILP
jgi:transposase